MVKRHSGNINRFGVIRIREISISGRWILTGNKPENTYVHKTHLKHKHTQKNSQAQKPTQTTRTMMHRCILKALLNAGIALNKKKLHTHTVHVFVFLDRKHHTQKKEITFFFQNREDQKIHHHTKGGKGGCNGAENRPYPMCSACR